jgi:uncharacterized protein YeaO (DUF488 family)
VRTACVRDKLSGNEAKRSRGSTIMIHMVCLHDQRPKGERMRVGAVRYQPRGWAKEEIAELYDVWLPELAPSRELRRRRTKGTMDRDTYLRRFRSQMKKPEVCT